ncbi:sterol desaturase family protein [Kordiimonas sp. SCSIO 12603]|uniref:sterol desaturase family protein n=1 Tax=Kordiimonas sp. SCSIO 12603 TaxID=2829596 RepID=UPI0021062456|nr:sterol desaturase family protein [Kordiimonas sp. SCSIO 12603]UTW60144.1 sterol desaturase family protein [Kordiimonas sp. SCSIO 12603]
MDTLIWVLERLWRGFTFDFTRYFLAAGGVYLIVWVLFNKQFAPLKIRKKTPRTRQMVIEFLTSMRTVLIYGFVGFLTFWGIESGVMRYYLDMEEYGTAYYIFSILFMIVAHDAYFYWTHRAMHMRGVMKYIHGEHHKSMNPTPWTAYRFDIFEAASHALFVPLFLLFVPLHHGVIGIFLIHMIIRNAMGHSGYELFPRSWATHPILGWLNLVTHHDMHHANGNYNFGLYFTWWDRICGTEHPDYIARVTKTPGATRANPQGTAEPVHLPAE